MQVVGCGGAGVAWSPMPAPVGPVGVEAAVANQPGLELTTDKGNKKGGPGGDAIVFAPVST